MHRANQKDEAWKNANGTKNRQNSGLTLSYLTTSHITQITYTVSGHTTPYALDLDKSPWHISISVTFEDPISQYEMHQSKLRG